MTEQHEEISESIFARIAFYLSLLPIVGLILYIIFALVSFLHIGWGHTGYYRLRSGLIAVIFLSLAPIAGLILWAGLPHEYYLVLNKVVKHGRISTRSNNGLLTQQEYFRFGKPFRRVEYRYYENGSMWSEANFVGDKLNGTFTYWYDTGKPRLIETFANNRRHGITSWFDKNGKLIRSIKYVDGISQEQIDAAKKACVPPVIEEDLGGGVKMKMVFIPPGEFVMGCTEEDISKLNKNHKGNGFYENEYPPHKVTIQKAFYLCETEVTKSQWHAILHAKQVDFNDSNMPMNQITWFEVKKCVEIMIKRGRRNYRLPSEAEMEYACRAGVTTRFHFGDSPHELGDYEWYDQNSNLTSHQVRAKKQNNWGLYDISGNVAELTEDDYHQDYLNAPNNGSAWIDSPRSDTRVMRGGGWAGPPGYNRTTSRLGISPDGKDFDIGVRFAKSIEIIPPEK